MDGRVEAIFVSSEHGELPAPVERVQARAGCGLEGNRYYWPGGDAPPGRAVTLVAAEAMDAVSEEGEISIEPAATRRNVLTRGIEINELVGKRFRIGEVECEGVELCEPCSHLESLTQPGAIKALVHRAGLNADILNDGEISVGDAVALA
ncbi:MAG: MOSC domain-containing protein [Actinobacteria bacterium]|nr:MAG: MOSC domain-containing protein [Actinomycetota bacterium]